MATSIISIAIAVALLWVAYRVLFINSNRLVFNRAFLIIALGFSLMLPMLGMLIGNSTPQMVSYKQSLFKGIMLDEVVITADGVTISTQDDVAVDESAAPVVASNKRSFDLIGLIGIIWMIGAIVAALIFLIKLGKLLFIIIRNMMIYSIMICYILHFIPLIIVGLFIHGVKKNCISLLEM